MRNASGHQCKEKMSGIEKKVNESTYDISSINKFLEVSRCSRAKQRKRNVQKKVCCTCKVAFLLIRPIVVFSPFSGVVWTNYKYHRELCF